MDPLIAILNSQAAASAGKVKQVPLHQIGQGGNAPSTFDKTLTEKMVKKIEEQFSVTGGRMDVKAIPGRDLKLTPSHRELTGVSPKVGDEFYGMFKKMNRDVLSLDTTMEWLTTPGTKFNVRDLFRIQTGLTETTLHIELGTKLVDVVTRDIQTLQNVGV